MFEIDNDKIKQVRIDAKLDQETVAMIVGSKPKRISHYETGRAKPPADTLLNYLIKFKIKPIDVAKKILT